MDKVSIIIPTFNRYNLISQSIESALAQDYPNTEVILADDASTDETPKIKEKYSKENRFKYFRNALNLGMTPNWKKSLFEYATGDWALILGDDDYFIDHSYLTNAMNLAARDRSIVMIHANCRISNEITGDHSDTHKHLPDIVGGKWMFINYQYPAFGSINFDLLTVIFDRKIAQDINIFSDTIISSDRESFLKLCLNGNVGFINDVVAVYRLHRNNLIYTLADINKFFENMRSVTSPYQYAKELGIFKDKELDRWKNRMITQSSEIYFVNMIQETKSKFKFLNTFIRRLYAEYPYSLKFLYKLLNPKLIAKCLGLRHFLKSFKGKKII